MLNFMPGISDFHCNRLIVGEERWSSESEPGRVAPSAVLVDAIGQHGRAAAADRACPVA